MKHLSKRLGLALLLSCVGCLATGMLTHPIARADQPQTASHADPQPAQPVQAVASVEELKSQAFKALRGGAFDRTSDLLAQAATLSRDPQVTQMADWTRQFETQRETFAAERHKQFDKAVVNVHLLLDHQMDSYALDEAARSYLLADNKESFRHEKWVDDLVRRSSDAADKYEDSEQWLKALRMYSDLGSLEPANPVWKDKLKLTTRRIRLLMVYTPDRLKKLQDLEARDRKAADNLVHPATQPSAPATQPATLDEDGKDNFRVDWHEITRGIKYSMLTDALVKADKEYYRNVTFQGLLEGGLTGIKTIVTTKGLEDAFPGIADPEKRNQFLATIDACMADANAAKDDNAEDVLDQSLDKLKQVNDQTVQLPEEVFVSEFADGAFSVLDPFSTVIWPYDVEEFQKTTQGEFGGVGIQIQSDEQGNLKVVSPLEDTPADRAGIKAGDIITHINGKNAKGIALDRAVKTITGTPGTTVTLTIRSADGTVKDYIVTREKIKVESVKGYSRKTGGGWDYFVDPQQKIAYLRLTNFTKKSADDMSHAIAELKKQDARAIVLDLRYNPGGLLQAATEIVNEFVEKGVIVSTHADRETVNLPTVANASPDGFETDIPMVVLVNQYSASASEIVSGALKDHNRALIVGERTFGKGSVQMLFPLPSKTAYLKLTTSHYYLPNGRCIHREENSTTWGVDPDVTVEMTPEQMRTAIDARQDLDVLHDAGAKAVAPTTQPAKKDLLSCDPQLSAALLVLRLELSGAQL